MTCKYCDKPHIFESEYTGDKVCLEHLCNICYCNDCHRRLTDCPCGGCNRCNDDPLEIQDGCSWR